MASTSGAVSAGFNVRCGERWCSNNRARNFVHPREVRRSFSIDGSRTRPAASPASRQGLAGSGFRVLVVARAVAVVVEPRDHFRAEARGVPPDGVGAVLVLVLGVPD